MTKRDIATWFCKIVGWVGISGAAIGLFTALLSYVFAGYPGNVLQTFLQLAIWGFVLLFAGGLGSALAGEGEYGAPIASKIELTVLAVRCGGFWLLANGALEFNLSLITLASYYFSQQNPQFLSIMLPGIGAGFLESLLGMVLILGASRFGKPKSL